jgi:hypothetical protein
VRCAAVGIAEAPLSVAAEKTTRVARVLYEPDDLGHRQAGGEMVHQPAVLTHEARSRIMTLHDHDSALMKAELLAGQHSVCQLGD